MNRKHIFLGAFVITIAVNTFYNIKHCHDLPWPPHFIGAGITFGLLSLFAGVNEDMADVMAVGITLAALVQEGFTGCSKKAIQQGTCCQHNCNGTVQTTSYQTIYGVTDQTMAPGTVTG